MGMDFCARLASLPARSTVREERTTESTHTVIHSHLRGSRPGGHAVVVGMAMIRAGSPGRIAKKASAWLRVACPS